MFTFHFHKDKLSLSLVHTLLIWVVSGSPVMKFKPFHLQVLLVYGNFKCYVVIHSL
jgi:hypothetical protein